jgi:peptide/nickel transport system substrate-binding protein
MNGKSIRTLWIATMLLALLQAGLGQTNTPEELIIAQPADIQFVDPQRTYLSSEAAIWHSLYDALVFRGPDMALKPGLATSWEQVSDTEWIFELQEGVTFHNGEPFNAEAVRWNFERATAEGFQDWAFLAPIASSEVIDDYTIRITTKNVYPILPSLMTMFLMVPPQYMEDVGIEGFNQAPVGTGPYRFVRWDRGSLLTVEANPDYWNDDKRATFPRVTWRIIPEDGTRLAALLAGEIDIMAKLPADDYERVDAQPELAATWVRSLRTPFFRFFPESPQGGGEPFSDIRVRQAFNHAINVDLMLEALFGGRGTRTATLMTPDFAGFDESIEPYAHDPERARQLLAEAGYPDGFTITFETWSAGSVPKPVEIAQIAAAQLEEVGITANVVPLDVATSFNHQNQRTIAPFHLWSWGGSQLECRDKFWGVFHPASSANFFVDDQVTQMIDELDREVDPDRRAQICSDLQRHVQEQALIVPLFAQADLYGYRTDLSWEARPDELVLPWEVTQAQ